MDIRYRYLRSMAAFSLCCLAASVFLTPVFALPQGEQVIAGEATFDRSVPDTLNVHQTSDRLIADYQSFSIARPEAVHFQQPGSSSVALNRVIGGDPSSILGTLTATGKIFLVNPNGIVFGQGARVDTAGLVASTLDIANTDFLAGRYVFYGPGGDIVNRGVITAPGGYAILLGNTVNNTGVIEAELGQIALAGGEAVTLSLDQEGIISVVVDEAVGVNPSQRTATVSNTGVLSATDGKVVLTARALDDVFDYAINNEGVIEADSLSVNNGQIVLNANQRVRVSGVLNARGGTIGLDVQGADFMGTVDASRAVYRMNDGDTNIAGGTFSGDQTFEDNLNITVNGPVTVNNGTLTLTADSDNNLSGDLNILSNLISNDGSIELSGHNIDIRFALIKSDGPGGTLASRGITLAATNDVDIAFSQLQSLADNNGDQIITVTADEDIDIFNSNFLSRVGQDGQSTLTLESVVGQISTGSARLEAQVLGDGLATVSVSAAGANQQVHDANSLYSAYVGGNGDTLINILTQQDLALNETTLSAQVDGSGSETVSLQLLAGDITQDLFDDLSDLQTSALFLKTGGSIGSSAAPILVDVDTIQTAALGGSIFISPLFQGSVTDTLAPSGSSVQTAILLANPFLTGPSINFSVLAGYRVVSIIPSASTNFYAYHPIFETDDSAFSDIVLDANAYEYIDGQLELRKTLPAYYNDEGQPSQASL